MDLVLIVIRLMLAAIFAVAALAKLVDRADFRRALREFGAPARLVGPLAVVVPLMELGVAAGLVLPGAAWWAAVAAVVMLLAFTAVIAVSLARGRAPDCNCFGRLSASTVGRKSILRNALFAAAAVAMVGAGPARVGRSAVAWVGNLSAAQQVGLAAAVTIAVLLASQGWLLIHLMRQHGRLLDRIAVLEHTLHIGPGHHRELPLLPAASGGNGGRHLNHHDHDHRYAGPQVGDGAPAVRLPDLDGTEVDLADFRGAPMVLLFWSPSCGFCQQMLPDLKAWEADRAADDDAPRLLLVSTGSVEDNRALGLAAPVLLDEGFAVGRAYGANGTPQAVLVNPDGTVAAPLAGGATAVLKLLETRSTMA
ncbi:MAG TPA: MauE/DoxX family redox-associated membrane protein [Pilimelia sp.]|nr:MauE/DoxX family redox-associated membrane protein [Pilimelia sp.]